MDRFAMIIEGLCRAVAAGRSGMAGPMILLIWGRLKRMARRLAGLAARAGRVAPARPVRRVGRKAPASGWVRLGRGFAWLVRLNRDAAGYGSQLQHLLTDPEMVALLAAAPGMARVMRPLCQMLGVRFVQPPPAVEASRVVAGTGDAQAVDNGLPDRRASAAEPVRTGAPYGAIARAGPW